MNTIVVTGSSGLVGSHIVRHYHDLGWEVHGVDNNMRLSFFGPEGDTRSTQAALIREHSRFHHHEIDVRDFDMIRRLISESRPNLAPAGRVLRSTHHTVILPLP